MLTRALSGIIMKEPKTNSTLCWKSSKGEQWMNWSRLGGAKNFLSLKYGTRPHSTEFIKGL